MKRLAFLTSLLFLFALPTFGQLNSNTLTLRFAGAPSGPCGSFMYAVNNATGDLYDCKLGAWFKIGPASGSGTVTSVGLAGTANQVTVTGATPITASGSWTLSVPSTFIAPGTFEAVTSVTSPLFVTKTKCAAAGSAAGPSLVACAAAPSGSFSCATNSSAGTCVIATTAVTASSAILVQPDSSLSSLLSVTCNTTADTGLVAPRLSARAAATSFTITLGTFTTNPMCFDYWIVN